MKVIQSQWDWEYTGVSKNLSANYIKKHYLLSSFGKLDSKKCLCVMSIPRDAQKQIGKRERSICDKKNYEKSSWNCETIRLIRLPLLFLYSKYVMSDTKKLNIVSEINNLII